MSNFLEQYGKAIFVLVLMAILIAFAHPLGLKIKEVTRAKAEEVNSIGTDKIEAATEGKENNQRPQEPETAVNQVYCIYYSDGEMVISQNEIEPESARRVQKQGFYSKPRDCTTSMTTARFEGAVKPKNCAHWFDNCKCLIEIINIQNLYTNECTDMSSMFLNCSALTNLDLNGWNTSGVKDMSSMFQNCSALTNLDISKWNTSDVTDMSSMFFNCSALTTLDISNLDTAGVTDMSSMFAVCSTLTNLDLNGLNTASVKDMSSMFQKCSALTNLYISKWDTSGVTNMSYMFKDCTALTSLDLSEWDTSGVKYMSSMFDNCMALTSLDLSEWDMLSVKLIGDMFKYCYNLKSIIATQSTKDKITSYNYLTNRTWISPDGTPLN